jgi:hypothetical protein
VELDAFRVMHWRSIPPNLTCFRRRFPIAKIPTDSLFNRFFAVTIFASGLITAKEKISAVEWIYKECAVTITAEQKAGEKYACIVKIIRPRSEGTALFMMGNSFPTAEMAENYGRQLAREWIGQKLK